jgi:hypothetical protein
VCRRLDRDAADGRVAALQQLGDPGEAAAGSDADEAVDAIEPLDDLPAERQAAAALPG